MAKPTLKEIENATKVQGFLSTMDDVAYKNLREDIFEVTCDGFTAIVDAEESIVCIESTVLNLSDVKTDSEEAELNRFLLEKNAESIHGKFAISGNRVVIKDNLEAENLDANEFEASLAWVFGKASTNIEAIAAIVS